MQARQQVEAVSLGPQVREGEVRSHVVACRLLQRLSESSMKDHSIRPCHGFKRVGFSKQLPGSFVYEAKRSSLEWSPDLTCNVLLARSGRRAMSTSMNTLEISNLGSRDLSICLHVAYTACTSFARIKIRRGSDERIAARRQRAEACRTVCMPVA